MKRLRIEVTQEDIEKGVPKFASKCAIAIAANRVGQSATVGAESVWLWLDGEAQDVEFATTRRARIFINNFDNGRPVEPSTFLLPRITD